MSTQSDDNKKVTKKEDNDLLGRIICGILLGLQFVAFVILLIWRLTDSSLAFPVNDPIVKPVQVNEVIIMALASCFGSLIISIRAFFEHACQKLDFRNSFIPWYFFWQIQGFILGLIFYFAVRGGIVLVTIKDSATNIDLNIWGLAAIGSLVGLFSQDAIKKLKDVFENIFQVKKKTPDTKTQE